MQGLVRWIAVTLLFVGLPLKGLAAAGFMPCGQGHGDHGAATSHAAAASAAAGAVHGHDRGHDRAHGHPHQHAPSAEPGATSGVEAAGDADPGHAKCTQCAPCCAAVAPATSFGVALPLWAASSPAATLVARWHGFVAAVPKPPPRA
jgi:hypothetical protein